MFFEEGMAVLAATDPDGCTLKPDGLNIQEIATILDGISTCPQFVVDVGYQSDGLFVESFFGILWRPSPGKAGNVGHRLAFRRHPVPVIVELLELPELGPVVLDVLEIKNYQNFFFLFSIYYTTIRRRIYTIR
jgi:hypothetical protein